MDYALQYDRGKYFAQAWQTVIRKEDLTEKQRSWVDPMSATSRHGWDGMTTRAEAALRFLQTGEVSGIDMCLAGQFMIFEQPWSGVHQGFTDYLSDELTGLYFSLPER